MTVILLLSFIQLSFSPQFLPPPTPIQDLIYPESTAAPIDSQIVQAVKCWVHNQCLWGKQSFAALNKC